MHKRFKGVYRKGKGERKTELEALDYFFFFRDGISKIPSIFLVKLFKLLYLEF